MKKIINKWNSSFFFFLLKLYNTSCIIYKKKSITQTVEKALKQETVETKQKQNCIY